MSKHTPGPWKVMFSTPKVGECTLAVWPADTVDGYVGSPICKVSPEHLMNGTDEANARLIAAAPELLEACESVLDQIFEEFGEYEGGVVIERICKTLQAARDKATKPATK